MSITPLGCKIPDASTMQELNLDPKEAPDVEKRLRNLDELMKAFHSHSEPQRAIQGNINRQNIIQNMQRVGDMVRSVHLSPNRGRGLQARLARDAAIVKEFGGIGTAYTDAGWVRESLARIKRMYRGEFNEQLRLAGISDIVADASKQVKEVLKRYGISQNASDYIMTTTHDLGWYPHLMQAGYIGQGGQYLAEGKIRAFAHELQNTYHLSPSDVDVVMNQGKRVVDAYINVGKIADGLNMNVSNKGFMDIIPRVLSDEAKTRFDWLYEDFTKGTIKYNTGQSSNLSYAAMMSRLSNDFRVEDEVVLDYIFRALGKRDHDDPLALYKAAGAESIGDILDEQKKLTSVFLDTLQRSPETISALVDNGILSKLPLTSRELVDRMHDVFQMPFEKLNEVFATDWNRGMQIYQKQLDGLAGRSGYINMVVSNAINGNWGVSTAEKLANPEMKDFVPLLSRGKTVPGAIPEEYLGRFGMGASSLKEFRQTQGQYHNLSMLENIWVHPTVAQMIDATLEIQTDPFVTTSLARVMHDIHTRFRALALTTLEYIPRQIHQSFVMAGAGGGDLLRIPEMLTKTLLSQIGGIPIDKFLNTTKKVYKTASGEMLTEAELWHYLQKIGYIGDFEPLTGDALSPNSYHPWNVTSAIRSARATLALDNGFARLGMQIGGGIGQSIDRATYPMRWSNNWVDNASRFASLASSMKRADAGSPSHILAAARRAATGGGFLTHRTVEDAVEHWRNYFYIYDDYAKYDKVLSNYVVPFWGFHAKNMPAVMRHIVQHPTRYIAAQRLYALANSPVANDDRLTEGSVQPWLTHTAPIYFRVPGGRRDGRDAFYAVPMSSIDPYAEITQSLSDAGSAVLNSFGVRTSRPTAERLQDMPWSGTHTNNLINQLLQNTYPAYQAIVQTATGTDLQTGQPVDNESRTSSFLGYEMPRMTSMWLQALLPILGTIDRANPGENFGTPTVQDPYTGQFTMGTPSQMPFSSGAPRTNRDSFTRDNPYRGLALLGVKVYPVDIALNAGMTHDQLSISVNEATKFTRALRRDIAGLEPGSDIRRHREQTLAETEALLDQTRADLRNLRGWARAHGFNASKAVSVLRQRNVRIGDLPPVDTTQPSPPSQSPMQDSVLPEQTTQLDSPDSSP